MLNLAEKSVVVTGGAGFLGRHVVAELAARGCTPVVPRSRDFDLTQADAVAELFAAVVHYAGTEHLSDDATAVLVRW